MLFRYLHLYTQSPQQLFAAPAKVTGIYQQQEFITVKGTVTDAQDGLPLPGVTISDQNRKVIGATDNHGVFKVKVAKGTTLSFNMIGYNPAEKVVNSNQENLAVQLNTSSNELNEVVVTALGIKREEKSLGYGITKIEGKSIADAPSNNWSDALKGKGSGNDALHKVAQVHSTVPALTCVATVH